MCQEEVQGPAWTHARGTALIWHSIFVKNRQISSEGLDKMQSMACTPLPQLLRKECDSVRVDNHMQTRMSRMQHVCSNTTRRIQRHTACTQWGAEYHHDNAKHPRNQNAGQNWSVGGHVQGGRMGQLSSYLSGPLWVVGHPLAMEAAYWHSPHPCRLSRPSMPGKRANSTKFHTAPIRANRARGSSPLQQAESSLEVRGRFAHPEPGGVNWPSEALGCCVQTTCEEHTAAQQQQRV
jgi:hypothetical protein